MNQPHKPRYICRIYALSKRHEQIRGRQRFACHIKEPECDQLARGHQGLNQWLARRVVRIPSHGTARVTRGWDAIVALRVRAYIAASGTSTDRGTLRMKPGVSSLLMIASRAPTYTVVSRARERNEDVTHQQASFIASVYVSKSAGAHVLSTLTTIWSRRRMSWATPSSMRLMMRSHKAGLPMLSTS